MRASCATIYAIIAIVAVTLVYEVDSLLIPDAISGVDAETYKRFKEHVQEGMNRSEEELIVLHAKNLQAAEKIDKTSEEYKKAVLLADQFHEKMRESFTKQVQSDSFVALSEKEKMGAALYWYDRNEVNSGDGLLFRMWNGAIGDHYYTSTWENMFGAWSGGWKLEGYIGWCAKEPSSNTLPWHSYWNPQARRHFNTSNKGELGGNVGAQPGQAQAQGWVYYGILCGIYKTNPGFPGVFNLYHWYNPRINDHFWNTGLGENNELWQGMSTIKPGQVTKSGWTFVKQEPGFLKRFDSYKKQ